jgi:hypothetical protein
MGTWPTTNSKPYGRQASIEAGDRTTQARLAYVPHLLQLGIATGILTI